MIVINNAGKRFCAYNWDFGVVKFTDYLTWHLFRQRVVELIRKRVYYDKLFGYVQWTWLFVFLDLRMLYKFDECVCRWWFKEILFSYISMKILLINSSNFNCFEFYEINCSISKTEDSTFLWTNYHKTHSSNLKFNMTRQNERLKYVHHRHTKTHLNVYRKNHWKF